MSEWETFCDESYYHLWRVRRKNERGFHDGFHVHNGDEAQELVELLNRLERERDEARERLHPDRAMQWLSAYYQAWFGDRSKWADDIADRFYKDTATLTLFCQDYTFPKEASK